MELRNFFKKNQIKDIAKNEQDFYQKNPRKKSLKIFAAASLALITCATTLLATAPFGTGAANAATNSNLSNNTQSTSPLGLDPENDPVLFTTSRGLEVKYANGAGTIDSGNLNGYGYFSLGEYNGVTINWVIIGYGSTINMDLTAKNTHSITAWRKYTSSTLYESVFDITNPAGLAISHENAMQAVYFNILATATKAVQNDTELGPGEFLCISERAIFKTVWGKTGANWSAFPNNDGHKALVSWFDSNIELLDTYNKGGIIDHTYRVSTSYGHTVNTNTATVTSKIFLPSAISYNNDSFNLNNYLTTSNSRICYDLDGNLTEYCACTGDAGHAGMYKFNTSGNAYFTGENSYTPPASLPFRPIIVCKGL